MTATKFCWNHTDYIPRRFSRSGRCVAPNLSILQLLASTRHLLGSGDHPLKHVSVQACGTLRARSRNSLSWSTFQDSLAEWVRTPALLYTGSFYTLGRNTRFTIGTILRCIRTQEPQRPTLSKCNTSISENIPRQVSTGVEHNHWSYRKTMRSSSKRIVV